MNVEKNKIQKKAKSRKSDDKKEIKGWRSIGEDEERTGKEIKKLWRRKGEAEEKIWKKTLSMHNITYILHRKYSKEA